MKRVDLFESSSEPDDANPEDLLAIARRKKVQYISEFYEAIKDESKPSTSANSPEQDPRLIEPSAEDEFKASVIFLENPPEDIKDFNDSMINKLTVDGADELIPEACRLYFFWRLQHNVSPNESWWSRNPVNINGQRVIPPPLPPFSEELMTATSPDPFVHFMVAFENKLRSLTRDRMSIGNLMVFVLDNAQYVDELVDSITRSIMSDQATFDQLLCRLYLLSDILHNSSSSHKEHGKIRSSYKLTWLPFTHLVESRRG